jgi:hypothetical protein
MDEMAKTEFGNELIPFEEIVIQKAQYWPPLDISSLCHGLIFF